MNEKKNDVWVLRIPSKEEFIEMRVDRIMRRKHPILWFVERYKWFFLLTSVITTIVSYYFE